MSFDTATSRTGFVTFWVDVEDEIRDRTEVRFEVRVSMRVVDGSRTFISSSVEEASGKEDILWLCS